MRRTSVVLSGLLWALEATLAHSAGHSAVEEVRAYISQKLGPPDRCEEVGGPTAIDVAWADLNGDGRPEALVYVSGRGWCGSGGCDLMVLERAGAGFRERGNISISRPPVAVLPTRSHGWRDVSVFVSGGGILPGYSAALPFDGQHYPENPSVPLARPLGRAAKVRNIFAQPGAVTGVRLYPGIVAPPPPSDLPQGVVTADGPRVEVSLPIADSDCWGWVNLWPPEGPGQLRFMTSRERRDSVGRRWRVWVFEATGPGESKADFALIPLWRFIPDDVYPDAARRAAAAKIWTAKAVVP